MSLAVQEQMKDLPLVRGTLDDHGDCDGCGCPLLTGEFFWRHEESWSTGCCQRCARDAAAVKMLALAMPLDDPGSDAEPFQLVPPKAEHQPERFENRPTIQRPLFIGADDLPGQTYLVDPFGKAVQS